MVGKLVRVLHRTDFKVFKISMGVVESHIWDCCGEGKEAAGRRSFPEEKSGLRGQPRLCQAEETQWAAPLGSLDVVGWMEEESGLTPRFLRGKKAGAGALCQEKHDRRLAGGMSEVCLHLGSWGE